MINTFFCLITLTLFTRASSPARCGPLHGFQKCPCLGSGNLWDLNTYCDENRGECGHYRSWYDASSGAFDCETNHVESLPTGCLKITNGNAAGIYKVNGLHAGKNRYVHTTNPSWVISWVHIGRYAWHITHNGVGNMHWYHDRDEYGINIGNDGRPAAGRIPGIPDLSYFSVALTDYESQAEGCMPTVTRRPTKAPTTKPTLSPTSNPTLTPTNNPTMTPTLSPSTHPTMTPTRSPSPMPTAQEFMMKINGFHGDPVSSLARIVFSQDRTNVEKIVHDVKTIKASKDSTRKN